MVVTIRNTDDFIRALRENEEFQAAARRELMTQDLLELPKEVGEFRAEAREFRATVDERFDGVEKEAREFRATVDERFDGVEKEAREFRATVDERFDGVEKEAREFRATVDERFDGVEKEAREFRATVDERFDGVEEGIEVVRKDINGLGESFRREVRAQSSYRGNYAQSAARGDDLEIAALFAGRYGLEDIDTRHISANTRRTWLRVHRDLIESLNLRPRARRTFLRPDMIVAVMDLYAGDDAEPEFYIVVESSYTGDEEDINRATDHARIVRSVTGMDAYAVVAAVTLDDKMDAGTQNRLYDDVSQFVEVHDDNAAFWHRLNSADLRPLEPR